MKSWVLVTIALGIVCLISSCYYNKAEILYPGGNTTCDLSAESKFSTDVLPILNANCNFSGCHNTTSAAAGVILDTYNGVRSQALNGRLIGSMNQVSGYSPMPKGNSKLPACTLAKIEKWVTSDAPNN